MFEGLSALLKKVSPIPVSEWVHLAKIAKYRELKAGEMLFRQGERSDVIAYIRKGLVYSYYVSHDDEKKVKKLAWEGRISSPYSSLLAGEPVCYFSAVALEDTKLICISFDELQALYDRHPCWQKVGRRLAEISLIERERREYETLCLSLEDRYRSFLTYYKDIVDRVPQYLVASYLGINPASLSRLRARRASAKPGGRQKKMREKRRTG